MEALLEALGWVQLAEWIVLAVVSADLWRRRRDAPAAWVASAFTSLAVVVVVAELVPEISGSSFRFEVALIVLFPYLLYRFMVSLLGHKPAIWVTGHALTAIVLLWTFLLPRIPEAGEPTPASFTAYSIAIAAQWALLLGAVTWRLWRSGRVLAAVARRRARLMAVGAFLLAALLVASALVPASGEATIRQLVTALVTLAVGPIFLLAFSPPSILRTLWRRREELAMREMEIELVRSTEQPEVAAAVLPAVLDLLGGTGAGLVGTDREVIGQRGSFSEELALLVDQVPSGAPMYEPVKTDSANVLPMENGWLVVDAGPLTPFFGAEELKMLSATAVVADLALGRARLFELEVRAREAMRDFVAIASHELRTPTTVVNGYAKLLSRSWDVLREEEKREAVEAIDRQSERLDRLIDDLLTVSKLDVDELEALPERVDVAAVIEEVVATVSPDTSFTCRTEGAVFAFADHDHVVRMATNYVRNASVYGEPPYSIDVVAGPGTVTVYVRDEGPGVPDDFVPHLFGRFARVDKKKSRAQQGTGLGLSIVRGLARANAGEAWYEHNRPRGACFAFRLPAGRTEEGR